MLTLDVVEREINDIVQHGTNYEDCARLANLYICRAGLSGTPITAVKGAEVAESMPDNSSSAFLQAVRRISPSEYWAILDELMNVLQTINPRLYDSVMTKLEVSGGR